MKTSRFAQLLLVVSLVGVSLGSTALAVPLASLRELPYRDPCSNHVGTCYIFSDANSSHGQVNGILDPWDTLIAGLGGYDFYDPFGPPNVGDWEEQQVMGTDIGASMFETFDLLSDLDVASSKKVTICDVGFLPEPTGGLIPEPTTSVLLGLGGTMLLLRRVRKVRRSVLLRCSKRSS